FVFTIAMGLLMVSNIRYFSFKEFGFKNRVSFVALLLVVLVYAFASIDPPKVLFAGFLIYAISGIVYTLIGVRARRKERKRGERGG
ncbi:MAG: CDP-diacylglycerol--serine O-phosphatidyltransferase, partial [Gammaproteobacteria bacterium]|nr:CDP-diacylglycerol--serine O-phosphatidyltransferase [Gammaproteobacteria bacterium]